ncbi:histidine phosphatase family protein [Cyanobium sp. LEGE 06113]|uniref:histidine phosphatase family protein n=1 Tax=Cyanobium sp. LEGE 06113 TaxID=1297573 RepID=UPI001881E95E|nr:histidine phosphatase family protein [Cyanobium sp. LEGE 06113]MBE9153689.1 histidine phosphatase family protein [Cyanobium sp. LEGE 06113]
MTAPAPPPPSGRQPPPPAAATPHEVLLVRHGETAWSLSGQHTGRTDLPLSARGEAEARQLQPALAARPFALVLCSPLQRARQTCALAGLAERAVIDPDLREWDYGRYEGLTTDQIHAEAPDWLVFRHGCPEGESPGQVARRADRVIARARAAEGPVVLFAHGHLLRVLAARWLELPAAAGAQLLLDTSSRSVLSWYRGIPALGCWNAPVAGPG